MNHKTVFAATFSAAILFGLNLLSGQHYPGGNYGPPPSGPSQYGPGCDSGCGDAYQPVYSDGGGWHGGGQYDDYGYGYDGCDYGDWAPTSMDGTQATSTFRLAFAGAQNVGPDAMIALAVRE